MSDTAAAYEAAQHPQGRLAAASRDGVPKTVLCCDIPEGVVGTTPPKTGIRRSANAFGEDGAGAVSILAVVVTESFDEESLFGSGANHEQHEGGQAGGGDEPVGGDETVGQGSTFPSPEGGCWHAASRRVTSAAMTCCLPCKIERTNS